MDRGSSGKGTESAAFALLGVASRPSPPSGQCLGGRAEGRHLAQSDQPLSFHPEVLTAGQKRALRQAGPLMIRRRFYLAGGTALAIQLGHRRSVDLDWFTAERIADPMLL